MTVEAFPPVHTADENGLLAMGGDLEVESLLLAYRSGIFPWPVYDDCLTWFAPPERALLFVDELHIPKSLKRFLRNNPYEIRVNQNFPAVIKSCAEVVNRGEQSGTWITDEIVQAYIELHKAGHAHSVECYDGEDLVGGCYGVQVGSMFAGESMFYRKANASKVCLIHLVELLRKANIPWLDCQVMTPNLEALGARLVKREEFMKLLEKQLSVHNDIFSKLPL